jgi:hypothetical protein
MQTTEAIREHIREELVTAIETKAAKYDDDEWSTQSWRAA